MKPVHLPITGHDLLAVERYHDDTRHMIEFLVFTDCPLGAAGGGNRPAFFYNLRGRRHLCASRLLGCAERTVE